MQTSSVKQYANESFTPSTDTLKPDMATSRSDKPLKVNDAYALVGIE